MKLFELLKKTISKMPNGWDETVEVNLSNGWTAPSDGILSLRVQAKGSSVYIGNGSNNNYLCVCALDGGFATSSGIARKGTTYKIIYKGPNLLSFRITFTPFSYRGGYLYRLVNFLRSLFRKEVVA